jgi:inner membrane protein
MSDGQYYISYASVFDSPEEVTINRYNTSPALLNDIKNEWGVQRLQWFTKGFYSVKEQQNKIVLSDLRMGMECYYVFNFAVGEKTNKGVQVSNFEKLNQRSNLSSLSKVWGRIWNPDVSLAPPYADKNCMKMP